MSCNSSLDQNQTADRASPQQPDHFLPDYKWGRGRTTEKTKLRLAKGIKQSDKNHISDIVAKQGETREVGKQTSAEH